MFTPSNGSRTGLPWSMPLPDEQPAAAVQAANASTLYAPEPDDDPYGCQNYANNLTYLNVSCSTDLAFSVPLYGYLTPLLVIVTLISNTLIVMVLSKRNMQTPTNLVLMGMIAVR